MPQHLLAALIAGAAIAYAILRIVRSVRNIREHKSPCASCMADCALRAASPRNPHCSRPGKRPTGKHPAPCEKRSGPHGRLPVSAGDKTDTEAASPEAGSNATN